MIEKKTARLRRARATRARIALARVERLTIYRTNLHIYARVISADTHPVGATFGFSLPLGLPAEAPPAPGPS